MITDQWFSCISLSVRDQKVLEENKFKSLSTWDITRRRKNNIIIDSVDLLLIFSSSSFSSFLWPFLQIQSTVQLIIKIWTCRELFIIFLGFSIFIIFIIQMVNCWLPLVITSSWSTHLVIDCFFVYHHQSIFHQHIRSSIFCSVYFPARSIELLEGTWSLLLVLISFVCLLFTTQQMTEKEEEEAGEYSRLRREMPLVLVNICSRHIF